MYYVYVLQYCKFYSTLFANQAFFFSLFIYLFTVYIELYFARDGWIKQF